MAIVLADWSVVRSTGAIRYIGGDHNGSGGTPSYATVIQFHRWLQDMADDASYSGNDEIDITDDTPSDRATDNYITLINGYNIDDTAAEHLFDGSIVQAGGAEIYDGIVNFGNPEVMIQIHQNGAVLADDWWNYSVGGTDDTSAGAAFLTDSTKAWTTNQWVGYTLKNVTDGSQTIITANTGTTITGVLEGGTLNTWTSGDAYLIAKGLNSDVTGGISHRFMIKVRTGGADIDNRHLLGTNRRFGKTYGSFNIPATSRGNNVLALSDSNDLNNTTAPGVVETWTDITNLTQGYNAIDVNNDTTVEYYFTKWNRGSRTINQFYERMKWLTRDGSAETLYGLSGELFRGITHELTMTTPRSGTFAAFESVSWPGGTGQMLAIDSTTAATKMWIQVLTGSAPGTGVLVTGASTATATTTGSPVAHTTSNPWCGASTGSALIGAYGFSLEYADLATNDLMTALDGFTYQPPNNVTFEVNGLVVDEDRVLVGPETAGGLNYAQFTLNGALTGATTSVVVNGSIPLDTPSSGTIRILRVSGLYSLHDYSAWSGSTFTITSHDFTSDNAANGANVFISYIDALADSAPIAAASLVNGVEYIITTVGTTTTWTSYGATSGTLGEIFTMSGGPATGDGFAKPRIASATFTVVFNAPRSLFIRVRDGGTSGDSTGIKTFETTGTLGSGGGSTTVIRTPDA